MSDEGLNQRALAARLQTTQGHLSKLLRGRFKRRSKLVRELEAFADRADTSQTHSRLLAACLRVARRSTRHMHFVTFLDAFRRRHQRRLHCQAVAARASTLTRIGIQRRATAFSAWGMFISWSETRSPALARIHDTMSSSTHATTFGEIRCASGTRLGAPDARSSIATGPCALAPQGTGENAVAVRVAPVASSHRCGR